MTVPQTDAIFDQIAVVNQAADASETVLRISLDAKATVNVGPFARGGKSRIPTAAADQDFHPSATVTPVGILLPLLSELFVYGITSKVTSDCLADCIERCWGILENHWNGTLLDTIDAVIQFAESMTGKGTPPLVELVTTRYQTGVKLRKAAMQALEAQITRLPGLERWFVDIRPRQAPVSLG